MNRQEALLVRLMEECCELGQRASKALNFGVSEIQVGHNLTNGERLYGEFIDVIAVYGMLIKENKAIPNCDDTEKVIEEIKEKQNKVEKYLLYSKELGTYNDDTPST